VRARGLLREHGGGRRRQVLDLLKEGGLHLFGRALEGVEIDAALSLVVGRRR
jgi:hypothetical protein